MISVVRTERFSLTIAATRGLAEVQDILDHVVRSISLLMLALTTAGADCTSYSSRRKFRDPQAEEESSSMNEIIPIPIFNHFCQCPVVGALSAIVAAYIDWLLFRGKSISGPWNHIHSSCSVTNDR